MTFMDAVSLFIKFFVLLTPFFVISVFLSLTGNELASIRHRLAIKVTIAIAVISLILLFFGQTLFALFGITVDAFRIGAGALLFLSSVKLVNGAPTTTRSHNVELDDLAVVPLAIPITLGPGSVGALVVLSGDVQGIWAFLATAAVIVLSTCAVGALLYLSTEIERLVGKKGISMLSKITGLLLAALSCQMMFEGIHHFLGPISG